MLIRKLLVVLLVTLLVAPPIPAVVDEAEADLTPLECATALELGLPWGWTLLCLHALEAPIDFEFV
jgi:hypothetical protein